MQKGLKPFYKGMGPLYVKLGPHTILCLVFWEELKGMYANHSENTNNDRNSNSVPMGNFYEKIGFFSKEETSVNYYNDSIDNSNFYWN
ncbi:hypothetical protein NQ314_003177 [Rhamnusium bicolor]|uniref:Uncharacterized protein n=1 Tax=Rhamnusium bicolor TaxID=1586634 RepID=A0AAV8ZQ98_9CUCU|nr:hypothetical protein NQ314_003177 [Rhamnusium bicolor]